ncbi:MAG: hypothetical protein ACM3NW_09795 [Syntrophomonadaceae bacterium]
MRRAPHSTDLDAYGTVLDLLRSGRPLYESTERYNYPPLWSWLLGGVGRAAAGAGVPFFAAVRATLVAVDVGVAALLYRLARRLGHPEPLGPAALYLANPIAIWVSAAQGQFDDLMILFLLLALLLDRGVRSPEESPRWSAMLSLAASIGIKQAAAFHPILWFRGRHRWRAALPWVLVALSFAPYAAQVPAIRDHVLFYRTVPRSFGFSEIVLAESAWAAPVALAACAAAAASAWTLRNRDPVRASLFVFLVLLVLAPGFGMQYLVWPIALGCLFPSAGLWLATAAGLLWTDVGGAWSRIPGVNQFGGQLLWLSLVYWTLREARARGLWPSLFAPRAARG